MRFGAFANTVTALLSLGHLYLYWRLLRVTHAPRGLRRAGALALVLLGPGVLAARLLLAPRGWPWGGLLDAVQWTWMVAGLLLLGVLAAADVGLWARQRLAPRAHVPERRRFLAQATAAGAVLATGGTVGYGFWRAYVAAPEVSEVVVRLPHLPRALEGFTLVQLSDVHVGSLIERRFMDELVARVNALRPDLVAITGDLVDGLPRDLGHAVAALQHLRSRAGTFFVTGNHEYHSNDLAWARALQGLGLQVLRNRGVRVGDAGGSFDLLGVDDWSGGWRRRGRTDYDLEHALQYGAPGRASVLLAHQPMNVEQVMARGVGLQLSGHTHGGQVFPMTALIGRRMPYVAGHYTVGEGQLYVSRGAGFWGPPLRIGSPPELVKVVLTA